MFEGSVSPGIFILYICKKEWKLSNITIRRKMYIVMLYSRTESLTWYFTSISFPKHCARVVYSDTPHCSRFSGVMNCSNLLQSSIFLYRNEAYEIYIQLSIMVLRINYNLFLKSKRQFTELSKTYSNLMKLINIKDRL